MRDMVTLSALSTIAATALAWLLTYALHSTLLLTGAWGVTRRLGRRSLALQETIWRCALIGGLVTASMQLAFAQVGRMPVAGGWTLASAGGAAEKGAAQTGATLARVATDLRGLPPISPSVASSASGAQPASPAAERPARSAAAASMAAIPAIPATRVITATSPVTGAVRRGVVTSSIVRQGLEPNRGVAAPAASRANAAGAAVRQPAAWPAGRILAAWLVGAFLLSAAYLRSYVLLRRRLRYRPRVVGGVMLQRLGRLVREAGIARPVRLTCTWRLRVPVALGGQVAEVCVPPRALFQLSDEQQDALLAHELAHLARRDPAWLLINQLMVALFFFQPLNWLARRRLRELSELICDQWAVAQTGRPLSLAACLAEVAAWSIGPRRQACLPVPGMADRPSQLAYRIRRLLDGTPLEGRTPLRREILWSALGVLAVVALVAPGISAGSTAAASPADAAPTVASGAASSKAAVGAAAQQSAMRTLRSFRTLRTFRALRGMRAMQAMPAGQGGEAPGSLSPDRRVAAPTAIAGPGASASLPHAVMVIVAMAQPAAAPAAEASEPAADAPAAAAAPPAPPSPSRPSDAPRAAPGEADLETAPGAAMDPVAERERIAAAAARLAALDKLANLSQEQIAAISKAVDQVTRELNGRLQRELNDLDHRIASVHGGLGPLPDLQAKELAHLDADLAEITAHVHFSPEDMSRLDAELKKLAADAPRVSREEIKRIKKEVQEEMQRHPNGGLTSADIEHIKTDAARAIEESRTAMAQALPPAEREKILAEARRIAAQGPPDKAQAEALRHLEQERRDLARLLEKQRADLESMRRDIEREAADYRDLARRESEAHRLHPHAAPAPKAAPPKPTPPAAAPPAPADSAPPGSPPS
jgi:hypothetical protein